MRCFESFHPLWWSEILTSRRQKKFVFRTSDGRDLQGTPQTQNRETGTSCRMQRRARKSPLRKSEIFAASASSTKTCYADLTSSPQHRDECGHSSNVQQMEATKLDNASLVGISNADLLATVCLSRSSSKHGRGRLMIADIFRSQA
jgi:hypothetical protein